MNILVIGPEFLEIQDYLKKVVCSEGLAILTVTKKKNVQRVIDDINDYCGDDSLYNYEVNGKKISITYSSSDEVEEKEIVIDDIKSISDKETAILKKYNLDWEVDFSDRDLFDTSFVNYDDLEGTLLNQLNYDSLKGLFNDLERYQTSVSKVHKIITDLSDFYDTDVTYIDIEDSIINKG